MLKTPLCDLLGIEKPVFQGGMAWIADGKLRPCLFSDVEYDLRTALREGTEEDQRAVFLQALGAKPDEHHDKVGTERGMSQIGG